MWSCYGAFFRKWNEKKTVFVLTLSALTILAFVLSDPSSQSKGTGISTNLIPTNWLFTEWFSSMLSVNSTSPLWSQILQALRWPKRSSSSADARENFSGLILPFASHSFYFFYPVHVRSDCQVRLGMGFLVQYSRKWVQLRVQYQAICGVVNGNTLQ